MRRLYCLYHFIRYERETTSKALEQWRSTRARNIGSSSLAEPGKDIRRHISPTDNTSEKGRYALKTSLCQDCHLASRANPARIVAKRIRTQATSYSVTAHPHVFPQGSADGNELKHISSQIYSKLLLINELLLLIKKRSLRNFFLNLNPPPREDWRSILFT